MSLSVFKAVQDIYYFRVFAKVGLWGSSNHYMIASPGWYTISDINPNTESDIHCLRCRHWQADCEQIENTQKYWKKYVIEIFV